MIHPPRISQLVLAALLLVPLPALPAADLSKSTKQPNIVLILADDLGRGHVGWQNPKVKTPHLDQLAKTGVQLDRHYVAPVCSPTRVALLTGRYWSRFGCNNALPSELDSTAIAMPPGTPTLGAALQAAGYRTALIGKWHLGAGLESGPEKFGFDHFYGLRVGGMTPLSHQWLGEGKSALWRNDKVIEEPGHITDLLAREAAEWLGKDSAQPFFLFLSFTSPHVPLSEPDQWMKIYQDSGVDLSHQLYWAAISHLDDAVGRVVAAVDRLGQRDNTVFVFLSDNGAPGQPNRMQVKQDLESYPKLLLPGDNLPFRGKKGDVYEGGIRTPGVVYWPGKLKPGVCEAPLSITDWMPTLCALAGCTPQQDLKWDGHDILPVLTGSVPPSVPRILYCKGPDDASAVSDGQWKLVMTAKTAELYNLSEDIGEKNDLAAQNPDLVRQLRAKLEAQSAKDNDAVSQSPRITQSGDVVALQNDSVRFEFDLARGTYSIFNQNDRHPTLSKARLRINEWSSDGAGLERTWTQRAVKDSSGQGLALDLSIKSGAAPELLFSFVLHEGQDFISASAGIFNSGTQPVRIKSIHVLADGIVYEGVDKTRDFAMVDGFSGGEPLEYGRRSYSPLTRANALKSRNNILLTFADEKQRRALVMGGLSYQDFEKFATIEQKRRTELELGKDRKPSLLCYLDLPAEKSDHSAGGEILELTKGKNLRTWDNHQFRCTETATSVMEPGSVVLTASNLKQDQPYTVGFSWWHGLRHGKHPDLVQSVFVEFEKDGVPQRLPLLENRTLPRFDGVKKHDVEQVELPLPTDAVQSGSLRIVVEKADATDPSEAADKNVYLSEIWLRDGRFEALLPATPAAVADGPRPRREFMAQLFASDPVGKRVDPGQRYQMPDQFYMDITGSDPFVALENYGRRVRQAQGVELSLYDFPTVCMWYAADKRYGGSEAENTSLGAVEEMKRIAASGFLKYSRASVRLVPDSYMPNNQQGWWDDKHWQREDTDRHVSQNGQYVKPYETTEKWGKAVTALGGIPLTYIQTSYRSEDYAKAFPGHMLFNKQYAWRGQPVDTGGEIFTTWEKTWTRNGSVVWGYDYTDPDFLAHMRGVYANLKAGGIRGLMFDYPESGRAKAGGMEDDYSTMAAAYRRIFQLAHEGLGSDSYVDERNMEFGSDVTLGVVDSMRTENDTDDFDATTVTRCGLRWYKNRVLASHDTDSKNLARLQGNRDHVRAVLTMAYVVTGRFLLANSFAQLSPETFHDLTRTFPYHTSSKSARPVDAFVSAIPAVYDFEVNPGWHQVTFFNADKSSPRAVGIDLSGPQVNGALGLDPDRDYYCFDFWNHRFIGKQKGDSRLEQQLRPGEARMISVRECLQRPQVLSTDRHVMQGYLDLQREEWDEKRQVLTGVSKIVGGDPYTVTLALNGHSLGKLECANQQVGTQLSPPKEGLVEFSLTGPENATVEWSVSFGRE